MLNKNDPLIGAVQEVMKRNQLEREAVKLVNEKFGVTDRKALPHEKQGAWDASYKQILSEGLHPNQQKLDVHEPEKDKLTKQDFKMLRAKKKPVEESTDGDTTSPSSMGIKKPDYAPAGTTPDYAKPKEQTVNRAAKTSLPPGTMKEEGNAGKPVTIYAGKDKSSLIGPKNIVPPGGYYLGSVRAPSSGSMKEEKATEAQKAKIAKVMHKWKQGKEHIGKSDKTVPVTKAGQKQAVAIALSKTGLSKKKIEEGFNNRHDLSVTASDENQVVADQLNEAGGVNLSSRPKRVVSSGNQKFVQNPFTSRGQIGRDYKTQAQSLRTKAGIATGKYAKARPTPGTGGYSATGNYTFNKLKDQAQTAALAATGNVTDLIGITDPKKSAGLRTFNPGAAQAGDLAGAASMLLPGRAPATAVSTAAKIKQGASIVPKIAKAEGQGNRLAGARKPGVNAGPWGAPSTAAAKTATTSAEKFKARANAMRRQVAGAEPKVVGAAEKAKAPTTPNAAAANATRVARTSARPATPNAAAANASRLRTAVGKAVNTTVNTARLVGGPSGPSSGSSFGAPSTAAAATPSATVANKPKVTQTTTATTPDYDKMSFKDAFKSARQQAGGASGKFKYKGKEYQTNIQGKGTSAKPQEKYQASSKLKAVAPAGKTQTTTSVTGGQGIAGIASTSTNKPVAKPIMPTASMSGGGVNKPAVDAKAQGVKIASSGLSKPAGATAQPYGMNIPAKLNPNSRIAQGNVPPKPQTMSANAAEGGLKPRTGQEGMSATQRRDSNYNSGVRGK